MISIVSRIVRVGNPVHSGLTRIRLQLAIYFCLHRGSLPENTARWQESFQCAEIFNHTAPCVVKRAGIVDVSATGHSYDAPIIGDSSEILNARGLRA